MELDKDIQDNGKQRKTFFQGMDQKGYILDLAESFWRCPFILQPLKKLRNIWSMIQMEDSLIS